jgi:hypothetical protein
MEAIMEALIKLRNTVLGIGKYLSGIITLIKQKYKLKQLYKTLRGLRLENGFYIASTGDYYRQFCWLRDVFYESIPELKTNPEMYKQTYHTLLDYFKMIEKKYRKFTDMIEHPHPKYSYRYIHARVCAKTFDEIHEKWGNKQNDICGEVFYGIAQGIKNNIEIIRDVTDVEIINKIIKYLEALEFFQDDDSGMWEEIKEVRSSSIGAVVSGLKALKSLNIEGIIIPDSLITKGEIALNQLLPRESATRNVDMSLLTLIYPFDIVSEKQRDTIIHNVEKELIRDHGCVRYIGDYYFNADDGNRVGNEAQWTMGKLYLALIYNKMGNREKAKEYLHSIIDKCDGGKIPELYVNGVANCNNPLGWSVALAIKAIEEIYKISI